MKATPAVDLKATYTALVNEGSDFFDAKNFKAALSVYWKAFRLRPTSPVLLFNIARTMGKLKNPLCEDFFAAAASQGCVDSLYELSLLYLRSNRRDAAVKSLRAYLKGNPANDNCTQWARKALFSLCPPSGPVLIWKNPETRNQLKKYPKKGSQKQVKFGIL